VVEQILENSWRNLVFEKAQKVASFFMNLR